MQQGSLLNLDNKISFTFSIILPSPLNMIKFFHSPTYTVVYICIEKLCFCINFLFSINADKYILWLKLVLHLTKTIIKILYRASNGRFSAHCLGVTKPTLVSTFPCKRSLHDLVKNKDIIPQLFAW